MSKNTPATLLSTQPLVSSHHRPSGLEIDVQRKHSDLKIKGNFALYISLNWILLLHFIETFRYEMTIHSFDKYFYVKAIGIKQWEEGGKITNYNDLSNYDYTKGTREQDMV